MRIGFRRKRGTERAAVRWQRGIIWYVVGAILIGVGLITLFGRRGHQRSAITGEVLSELVAADRIEVAPAALEGWNVLVITMDTTRADHIGCYGNQGVETPVLDGLARGGVLFAKTITPVPATLPAIPIGPTLMEILPVFSRK